MGPRPWRRRARWCLEPARRLPAIIVWRLHLRGRRVPSIWSATWNNAARRNSREAYSMACAVDAGEVGAWRRHNLCHLGRRVTSTLVRARHHRPPWCHALKAAVCSVVVVFHLIAARALRSTIATVACRALARARPRRGSQCARGWAGSFGGWACGVGRRAGA